MKLALCLSGGEFKGAFQAGFIRALAEKGIRVHLLTGISIGTVNASFVAENDEQNMLDLYDRLQAEGSGMIYTSEFLHVDGNGKISFDEEALFKRLGLNITQNIFGKIGTLFKAAFSPKKFIQSALAEATKIRSVADNTPLLNILLKYGRRKDASIPFRFGFVSLASGEEVIVGPEDFDNDEDYANALCASACMPGMWEPVRRIQLADGRVFLECVDGGLRTNAPLSYAIDAIEEMGQDAEDWRVVCLNCNTLGMNEQPDRQNLAGIAARTLNIMLDQVLRDDIDGVRRVNDFVKQTDGSLIKPSTGKPYKYVNLEVIELPKQYAGFLDSSPEAIQARLQAGYDLGKKWVDTYKTA